MLIDTHAHLTDERLYPEIEKIVADMPTDGLEYIVTVGYDRESSAAAFNESLRFNSIKSAVGIHPHDAKNATVEDYRFFEKCFACDRCVAIGEIGLDYYYDFSPREMQKTVFMQQLELAYALKAPIIIHLRDAYGDMLKLLKANANKLYYGALLHCYSGSSEMLTQFAALGLKFAYGGATTFVNAHTKVDVIKSTPKDSLMVETDCPYLTPVPYRGKTNYPKYVNIVADRLAEVLELNRDEIDRITTSNAKEFFKLK